MITFSPDTLFFDIESHSVDERYDRTPEDFFRLGQWAWGESTCIQTTTDLGELVAQVRRARVVVGANISLFDLPAIFGQDSYEPVKMAEAGRVFDTTVAATLANPAPFGTYVGRSGKTMRCVDPPEYRKWYGLDNQAFQLGTEGKTADLKDLADRYTHRWEPVYSAKTGRRLKHDRKVKLTDYCCEFSMIPVDDRDFLEYARQDVTAVREVARKLLELHPFNAYMRWEMTKVALASMIGRTGWRVDTDLAKRKVLAQAEEAAFILNDLRDRFDFPVSGKKPLASKAGKAALLSALAEVGVEESTLARTEPTDSHPEGQPSFSGDSVTAACEGRGEAAEALGAAVATLAGQRSLPELLLTEVKADGRVHPEIFPLQRSGRFSTTKPGLTIWSPDHKDLLIANSDDELLVEFDFSNADARAVAAVSGDRKFAKRFEPGQDGHLINAHLLWGPDVVGLDKHDPVTAGYRQRAKAPGHGIGYNMGAWKMAQTTGLALKLCKTFIDNYRKAYSGVTAWQARVVEGAKRRGYIMSDWGRRMVVQRGRETTMGPGVVGQNATHEILCLGIARCDERRRRQIVVTVHDAFVASIPKDRLEEDIAYYYSKFSMTWSPKGGQPIEFTLGSGTPGRSWAEAAH